MEGKENMQKGNIRLVSALYIALIGMVLIGLAAGCGNPATPVSGHPDVANIVRHYPDLSGKRAEAAVVTRVVDGDTVELANGEKVRLIGVNTPEIHGKTQPYGKEAAAFTKRELEGRDVVLFSDVSDTDRYGRKLRYLFVVGDDKMFNERLASEGYAQVMTIQPNAMYADLFVEKQRDARKRGVGLWGRMPDEAGEGGENGGVQLAPPACPDPIKGNISSKGDKIYHIKGSAAYERTKPEQWFCTEREAAEAGFRKAAK